MPWALVSVAPGTSKAVNAKVPAAWAGASSAQTQNTPAAPRLVPVKTRIWPSLVTPAIICSPAVRVFRNRLEFAWFSVQRGDGDLHIRAVHARRRGAATLSRGGDGSPLAESVRSPRAARASPTRRAVEIGDPRGALARHLRLRRQPRGADQRDP